MTAASEAEVVVSLRNVEQELARQMRELQGGVETPVTRACMSNLVVFCERREEVDDVAALVPSIVASHPARVILLFGEPATADDYANGVADDGKVTASVLVRWLQTGRSQRSFSEQVSLHAKGGAVGKLPFAVRSLLIGDLPVNLWWRSMRPPPLAGPILYDLAEHAEQIVYDSLGWFEPARAVAAASAWLGQFEQGLPGGRWRVASDLNWRRLKFWRRILRQALDEAVTPDALTTATELHVEHGPHAVVQAWELVSWLTSQLGWRVLAGNVKEGTEIAWNFEAPHGKVRVRIQRLPQGPPEVLRLRLACTLSGKPGAVVIRLEDSRQLIVEQEGVNAAARTVNTQPQSLAELLSRQLSDRERDSVFDQSMVIAQKLAKSLVE